jgi:hypothetical protein
LDELEIVEVTYEGLAAGRGVIWLRVRLWVSVLGVEIRNSFDFFRFFFFAFRCFRYSRRCWLLLKFVDVSEGIINLKDKVVDLLLEELDNRVTLSDYCITLIDLILSVDNGLISLCDNSLLFWEYSEVSFPLRNMCKFSKVQVRPRTPHRLEARGRENS